MLGITLPVNLSRRTIPVYVYEYTQITIRNKNNPDLLYGERPCPPGPAEEWRAAGPAATPPATDGQSAWRSRD
jgi:hypothetical protein